MKKRRRKSAQRKPGRPKSAPPKSFRPKLLQTRRDSAHQLGVSIWQIRAFEARGLLTSIRLTDSPTARSYNSVAEVEALARGEGPHQNEAVQEGAAP
jgi:hypothetical protein